MKKEVDEIQISFHGIDHRDANNLKDNNVYTGIPPEHKAGSCSETKVQYSYNSLPKSGREFSSIFISVFSEYIFLFYLGVAPTASSCPKMYHMSGSASNEMKCCSH